MARFQRHRVSQPEQYSRRERDGAKVWLWASVVAGRDAPPVLKVSEHDLDAVTLFVAAHVVSHGLLAKLLTRNTELYLFVFQHLSRPVGVISSVRQ